MMDWLTAPQVLPRWVVWTLLLTGPALWSRQAKGWVKRKLGQQEGDTSK